MKVLIVAQTPTHPTTDGNQKLILEYSELLKRMGHTVHYLRVVDNISLSGKSIPEEVEKTFLTCQYWADGYREYKVTYLEHIKNSISSQIKKIRHLKYRKCDDGFPRGLIKFTKALNNEEHYDAIIVNYIWLSRLLEGTNIDRKALFTHDYFSYKDLLTGRREKYACLPTEEAKALQRAPYIFAMQDEEAVFFRMLSPKSKVLINYANFRFQKQSISGSHNLLFLSGGNPYNVEGILWFINDVYPSIKKEFPDVGLLVGGSVCKSIQSYAHIPGIDLQGWVENPWDFYTQGDVVINPTIHGTGLKIKTFEGISFGKVVMAHPHSTIGIYKKSEAPLFSSDKASDWVAFLNNIWGRNGGIERIQTYDEAYINSMNGYIENQFRYFLGE